MQSCVAVVCVCVCADVNIFSRLYQLIKSLPFPVVFVSPPPPSPATEAWRTSPSVSIKNEPDMGGGKVGGVA